MNRVTHASCLLLLVAGCGGELLSSPADGKDPTDASVSLPDSQLIVDGYVDIDVTGQSCVVGTLCPNGVTCLDGSCQIGNCRWDWDCYNSDCSHGWCCDIHSEYGPVFLPSIGECLEQPPPDAEGDAGVVFCSEVQSYAVPVDGPRVTDCQDYPEAGAMCNLSGSGGYLYCWEYPQFGVCMPTDVVPMESELIAACQQSRNVGLLCVLPGQVYIQYCQEIQGSGVCRFFGAVVPMDGGLVTDCQDYPDVGVVCQSGPSVYCQELEDVGACVYIKWAPPRDQ
jgi:hypothetical protein